MRPPPQGTKLQRANVQNEGVNVADEDGADLPDAENPLPMTGDEVAGQQNQVEEMEEAEWEAVAKASDDYDTLQEQDN
eukprot:4534102-Alexandrium_andersonii.AAC.1